MKKTFIIMAITMAALVVIYLIYDLIKPSMTSPCEGIWQQTAVQLTSSLKMLEQTGGVSIGEHKIQELSEAAQVVALNLKTCCIMHVNRQITDSEFLKCQEMGEVYHKQVIEFNQNVNEAEYAKQKGDSALLNQKLNSINSQLDGLQQSVQQISQHAEAVKQAHPNAATEVLSQKKNTIDNGPTTTNLSGRINLLLNKNGGQILVAPDNTWLQTIDSSENVFSLTCCEAVYGFKEDRRATFDVFCLLINSTDRYNIQKFQLLYSNDSPTGAFDSIKTFTTVNAKLFKTPYQEFSFPKVTAKYLKVKLLSNYDDYGWNTAEFQLWGTLK